MFTKDQPQPPTLKKRVRSHLSPSTKTDFLEPKITKRARKDEGTSGLSTTTTTPLNVRLDFSNLRKEVSKPLI